MDHARISALCISNSQPAFWDNSLLLILYLPDSSTSCLDHSYQVLARAAVMVCYVLLLHLCGSPTLTASPSQTH